MHCILIDAVTETALVLLRTYAFVLQTRSSMISMSPYQVNAYITKEANKQAGDLL
jgi:hypothetical protein